MNGFPEPPFFNSFFIALIADNMLAPVNGLWVVGALAAGWLLLSAMSRRRLRLTELLRLHVKNTQDAHQPPDPVSPTDDSNS